MLHYGNWVEVTIIWRKVSCFVFVWAQPAIIVHSLWVFHYRLDSGKLCGFLLSHKILSL